MDSDLVVVVCGGRDWHSSGDLERFLDSLDICLIATGGAPGADRLGETYARKRQIPFLVVPAQWRKHGRAAGPIRNKQLLDLANPDLVVALPGGRGTENMVILAESRGIRVEPIPC